jgi:hypothetical protein
VGDDAGLIIAFREAQNLFEMIHFAERFEHLNGRKSSVSRFAHPTIGRPRLGSKAKNKSKKSSNVETLALLCL